MGPHAAYEAALAHMGETLMSSVVSTFHSVCDKTLRRSPIRDRSVQFSDGFWNIGGAADYVFSSDDRAYSIDGSYPVLKRDDHRIWVDQRLHLLSGCLELVSLDGKYDRIHKADICRGRSLRFYNERFLIRHCRTHGSVIGVADLWRCGAGTSRVSAGFAATAKRDSRKLRYLVAAAVVLAVTAVVAVQREGFPWSAPLLLMVILEFFAAD